MGPRFTEPGYWPLISTEGAAGLSRARATVAPTKRQRGHGNPNDALDEPAARHFLAARDVHFAGLFRDFHAALGCNVCGAWDVHVE